MRAPCGSSGVRRASRQSERRKAQNKERKRKGLRRRSRKQKNATTSGQRAEHGTPSGNQRQATISKCDTDYHQGGSAHSALKDPLSNAHHVEAAPLPARATVSRRRSVSRAVLVARCPLLRDSGHIGRPCAVAPCCCCCSRAVLITCRPLSRDGSHDRHPCVRCCGHCSLPARVSGFHVTGSRSAHHPKNRCDFLLMNVIIRAPVSLSFLP